MLYGLARDGEGGVTHLDFTKVGLSHQVLDNNIVSTHTTCYYQCLGDGIRKYCYINSNTIWSSCIAPIMIFMGDSSMEPFNAQMKRFTFINNLLIFSFKIGHSNLSYLFVLR